MRNLLVLLTLALGGCACVRPEEPDVRCVEDPTFSGNFPEINCFVSDAQYRMGDLDAHPEDDPEVIQDHLEAVRTAPDYYPRLEAHLLRRWEEALSR